MSKTLVQTVKFKAKPERLFSIYTNAKEHAAMTGAKTNIRRKAGASFTAYNGCLKGKNLLIAPGRLVVQAWRSADWKKNVPDSILTLSFEKATGGAQITLTHANLPDKALKHIDTGWHNHYWKPLRKYLKSKKK